MDRLDNLTKPLNSDHDLHRSPLVVSGVLHSEFQHVFFLKKKKKNFDALFLKLKILIC